MNERDYIVRATAADEYIRAFAVTSRGIAETARVAHNLTPVATAALGRLLSGAAMMGIMMKGDRDILTVRIDSSGPLHGLLVTADSHGHVKGYVGKPDAEGAVSACSTLSPATRSRPPGSSSTASASTPSSP